jgi:hypothetical protein
MALSLTIKVETTYSDGHESERVEAVEVEPFDGLEELWEHLYEQVYEYLGDGHGIGRDLDVLYTVTILASPQKLPELVGLSNEWG